MIDSVDYRREEGCNVVTLVKNADEEPTTGTDAESAAGTHG